MALVNTYFDFEDYSSPIKTYLDDQFTYDFVPNFNIESSVFLRKNAVETQDSIWHYTPDGDKNEFIGVSNVGLRTKPELDDEVVMTVTFLKDSKSDTYSRSVFSVLEMAGNIGGLNEVLEVIGGLLVGFFAERLFMYSILSYLYQVDPVDKRNINDDDTEERFNNARESKYQMENTTNSDKDKNRQNIISKATSSMKNRFRYSYSMFDYFYNLTWPLNLV
mmetsp:Transcript_43535/g.51243  ORF Transcript_43535/g.51243 Transcript_43535/m.51243 type:complete len:220 (-) Transcript_43535:172-831(-)